jgi:hypothetical protein
MFIRNKPRKRIKTEKEGEKQGQKTNENEGKEIAKAMEDQRGTDR